MIPAARAVAAIAVLGIAALFLVPILAVGRFFSWSVADTLTQWWFGLVVRMIGVKVTVYGEPAQDRPLLVAANHASWLDFPVIGAQVPVRFAVAASTGSARSPGWFSRLFGAVASHGSTRSFPKQNETPGHPVVVFAEGATGGGNSVRTFQSDLIGAARDRAAGDSECWLQPLSIAYTRLQGLPMGRQFRPVAAWSGTVPLLPHIWTVLREYSVDAVIAWGDAVPIGKQDSLGEVACAAEKSVRILTANVLTGREPRSGVKRAEATANKGNS